MWPDEDGGATPLVAAAFWHTSSSQSKHNMEELSRAPNRADEFEVEKRQVAAAVTALVRAASLGRVACWRRLSASLRMP